MVMNHTSMCMWELNMDMSKLAFIPIIFALVATILSPSVVMNTFAKSLDGDSDSDDKPKTSGHRKGGDSGGGMPVPGVPAVPADNTHKDKDSNNGGKDRFPSQF